MSKQIEVVITTTLSFALFFRIQAEDAHYAEQAAVQLHTQAVARQINAFLREAGVRGIIVPRQEWSRNGSLMFAPLDLPEDASWKAIEEHPATKWWLEHGEELWDRVELP